MDKQRGRARIVGTLSALGAAASMLTLPASAQLAVPEVGVRLPEVALPAPAIDARTPALSAKLDTRKLHVQARLRAHPAQLALDSRGELIVRGELLAEPASQAALAEVLEAGFKVQRRQQLAALDLELYVLQAPAGWSLAKSLRRLRKIDPAGHYDYHHVLGEVGSSEATAVDVSPAPPRGTAGSGPLLVGLIDGGVAATHEAFAGADLVTHGCGGRIVPSAHGTAVASLLVETLGSISSHPPVRVQLLAADVFCSDAEGGSVERVVDSLAWMAQRQVPIINVSLVGPRNRLLERVVARVIERGHVLVAAVGNDGPAAPPLYPAAYPGVVGVTGVDRRGRALLEACRGPHVAFAALGANLQAAAIPGGRVDVRGTSYAAPQVAALLALQLRQTSPAAVQAALDALARAATDLGPRGRDPVYGHGWVAVPTTLTAPASLMSKERD